MSELEEDLKDIGIEFSKDTHRQPWEIILDNQRNRSFRHEDGSYGCTDEAKEFGTSEKLIRSVFDPQESDAAFHKMVSVQAIDEPSSKVFHMTYKFSNKKKEQPQDNFVHSKIMMKEDDSPIAVPTIDIAIEQENVTALTAKLAINWQGTKEHLAEKFIKKMDEMIVNDLAIDAGFITDFGHSNKEELVEKITDVRNIIHRKTLRGSASFIVASESIINKLKTSDIRRPFDMISMDVSYILLGFKGNSWLESGYAYCPYEPFLLFDEESLGKRMMTRYATKMFNPDFYARIDLK